jgi:Rrf2 family protein
MNISSRCEYACRAVIELALHQESQGLVTSVNIAEKRNIPDKYLVHILIQLKRAGLVRSIRGSQGGYMLSKPAEDITLLDIVEAIDGPVLSQLPLNDGYNTELHAIWENVARGVASVLERTSVRDLADDAGSVNMYHI